MKDIDHILKISTLLPLPSLEAQLAERLIFLVHEGVNWDIWGGKRRMNYWEALTDRVRAATYAGPTLLHWWEQIAQSIESSPKSAEHRALVSQALIAENQKEVLKYLRYHATVLVMRVRVHIEFSREQESGNEQ